MKRIGFDSSLLGCALSSRAKFVRIHRSVIVNVDQVSENFREGQSEGSEVRKGGQRLRMSKARWQGLVSVGRR